MNTFWQGFEKRSYSWKTQLIGAGIAPVVGASVGAIESDATPYRGAILGGMAGVGGAIGSTGGKAIGDFMKEIASGNPDKLKKLKILGKYMPLLLGIGGASIGSYNAMKWLAGLRDAPGSSESQKEQPLQVKSIGP